MKTNDTKERWIVFSDDWGRHPSSCQHLIRELLPHYEVIWINTIGMRAPKFDRYLLTRGLSKLLSVLIGNKAMTADGDTRLDNLDVKNPVMWPWFRTRIDQKLNAWLLWRCLKRILADGKSTRVITTIPIVADLLPLAGIESWTYYCVDDFSVWPGLDHQPIEQMELRLLRHCSNVVAASEVLRERLHRIGREASLLNHGVHLDFWAVDGEPAVESASGDTPVFLFWGVIDPRIDVEFVQTLLAKMDQGVVWLAGPQQDMPPELLGLPRLKCIGAQPFARLPEIAAQASVLIMPYVDEAVTRAMQPLKLKEYMATGKPVVVRALPATQAWADCVDIAYTAIEFADLVCARALSGLPDQQGIARQKLRDESWCAKSKIFEKIVRAA
ncbi:MAG: hypothetical protein HN856_17335 [Gammaproteobacteria bacterium]|nr:hypothetical protein [Gammaproteobacteria bacterium]